MTLNDIPIEFEYSNDMLSPSILPFVIDTGPSIEPDRIPVALGTLSLQPDTPGRGIRASIKKAKPENVRVRVESIKKYG